MERFTQLYAHATPAPPAFVAVMRLQPHRCPVVGCVNAVWSHQKPSDGPPYWLRCDDHLDDAEVVPL